MPSRDNQRCDRPPQKDDDEMDDPVRHVEDEPAPEEAGYGYGV